MENPIKMDDLGVPLLLETPICTKYENIIKLTGLLVGPKWIPGYQPRNIVQNQSNTYLLSKDMPTILLTVISLYNLFWIC